MRLKTIMKAPDRGLKAGLGSRLGPSLSVVDETIRHLQLLKGTPNTKLVHLNLEALRHLSPRPPSKTLRLSAHLSLISITEVQFGAVVAPVGRAVEAVDAMAVHGVVETTPILMPSEARGARLPRC